LPRQAQDTNAEKTLFERHSLKKTITVSFFLSPRPILYYTVGLLVRSPDGADNYDIEANQTLAANLKGKLLLAHGTMDSNVPPENTMV
jgi:hypothetical protein